MGCIVPRCKNPALNRLGVRCRVMKDKGLKGKTGALWAPETNAWLCNEHAMSGAHITLIYEPNESSEVSTGVICVEPARRVRIR